jgi:hypothetical protein
VDAAWLTLAAARNQATRHAAAFAAVGAGQTEDDEAWWATEPGPVVYHDWISLRPSADAFAMSRRLAAVFDARGGAVSVLDPWSELDLDEAGFSRDRPQPWFVREPGRTGVEAPDGLELRPVETSAELAAFERTMAVGFGASLPVQGSLLGPDLVADPGLQFWLGLHQGVPVVTATAVVAGGVVGIYDVATLPTARGRGFATAATGAALAGAPLLPAVLEADADVGTLYTRLGFRGFGVFRTWWRPAREVAS